MSSGISEVPMTSGISEVIVTADGAEWLAGLHPNPGRGATVRLRPALRADPLYLSLAGRHRRQHRGSSGPPYPHRTRRRTHRAHRARPPLRGPLHPGHLHRQCQPCLRRVGPDRNRGRSPDPRWSNFGPKPSRLDNRIRTRGDRRHGRRAVSPPRTGIRTSPEYLHRADLRCQGDQ